MSGPNLLPLSLRWAAQVVDALAQAGLRHVLVAPGSRSTPLTLACFAHPQLNVIRHLDERSAGFFALGMALERDEPVGLVCTSGTAVANFMPAVVEARMSQVPLLLLTADRPPELRRSGANQTIDQVKFFGEQVLWAVDMPLPEGDAPAVAVRGVRRTAVRAFAAANGLRKGPVHLNFPFRKPLEPQGEEVAGWREALQQLFAAAESETIIDRGRMMPTAGQIERLAELARAHPHGLIVCGPRCPGGAFPQAAAALARKLGYPLAADPLSGLRFGPWADDTPLLSSYETMFTQPPPWAEPTIVIRFGAVPLSKWLNQYLDRISPAHRVHVRENGVWADDSQRTTWFLQGDETAICRRLAATFSQNRVTPWLQQVMQAEKTAAAVLQSAQAERFFEGGIVRDVAAVLPENGRLLLGNSLPVRHFDQFALADSKRIHPFANRGASGIDGNISTALGIAAATTEPVVLIIGDVTFFHDMNGLLPVRDYPNLTIVLLNNDGGAIFGRLPIHQLDPPFTDLFRTPHALEFQHAAQLYGLQYRNPQTRPEFRAALQNALVAAEVHLLEIKTDAAADERQRRELIAAVHDQLTHQ